MLVLKKKPDESKSVLVTRAIFALLCSVKDRSSSQLHEMFVDTFVFIPYKIVANWRLNSKTNFLLQEYILSSS